MRGKEIRHPDFGGLRLDVEPVHPQAVIAQNVDLCKPGLLSKRPGLRRMNQTHYAGVIVMLGDVQRICDYGKFLVLADPNWPGPTPGPVPGPGPSVVDHPPPTIFDPDYAPVAVANGGPLVGVAPLPVGFSSAGSYDPNGGPLTYHWAFGDGAVSNQPNPAHLYTVPGLYNAVLTVTNAAGKTATDAVGVTINAPVGHWDGAAPVSVWEAGP